MENQKFTGGLPPDHISTNPSGNIMTCTKCYHFLELVEDGKTDLNQCKIEWINKHLHEPVFAFDQERLQNIIEEIKAESHKYYIPTAEEIHVGFHCQIRNDMGQYIDQVIDVDDHLSGTTYYDGPFQDESFVCSVFDSIEHDETPFIRVKYLDHDDIIECGWRANTWDEDGMFASIANFVLQYFYDTRKAKVYFNNNGSAEVLFTGNLKNKSELQRIMEQVGITQ